MHALLTVTLVVLAGVARSSHPPGLDFVGVGYNLLKGNPDGGSLTQGGVDPGINLVRRILHISSSDRPAEVLYGDRRSCSTTHQTYMFYGTKSYQEKLGGAVDLAGDGDMEMGKYKFGLSGGYKSAKSEFSKNKKVFQDFEQICNRGSARFADELATLKRFSVSSNFAAAVCRLSHSYDAKTYMKFLDDWGTHVIVEVAFGTKKITRHESSLSEFLKQVQKSGGFNLSLMGSYAGAGASLGIDFQKFKASSTFQQTFGSLFSTLNRGDSTHPEPIHLKLKTLATMLDSRYWLGQTATSQCHDSKTTLSGKKINLLKALRDYARYKLLSPPTDSPLRIPIRWPKGTYGIAAEGSSCPTGNVAWNKGSRTFNSYDKYEPPHHYPYYHTHKHKTITLTSHVLNFCMKGHPEYSEYDPEWPAGEYCIYKYQTCPSGFSSGSVFWDDLHISGTSYTKSTGSLPDGQYGGSTRLYFCCREDKLPTQKIYLPIEKPFVLFKYKRECQQIHGMSVSEQKVQWIKKHEKTHDSSEGAHPYDDGNLDIGHALHMCHYHPSGKTLIG